MELAEFSGEVIPDRWPGEGPLGGVATALSVVGSDVVVVACDLPGIDSSVLEVVAAAGAGRAVDVAVARTDRRQPLVARWNLTALPAVERAVTEGRRSAMDLLGSLTVAEVPVDPESVVDIDDHDDLELWRRTHVGGEGPAPRIEPMAVRDVTVEDLESALASGARLIDVREPAEYEEMRIDGASLIPLSTVPDNLEAFRSDAPVYVMCRSGGRSIAACEFVASQGCEVLNVEGGIMAWVASGRPVALGES
jgi:rhodanese-related sulfurtransferase